MFQTVNREHGRHDTLHVYDSDEFIGRHRQGTKSQRRAERETGREIARRTTRSRRQDPLKPHHAAVSHLLISELEVLPGAIIITANPQFQCPDQVWKSESSIDSAKVIFALQLNSRNIHLVIFS